MNTLKNIENLGRQAWLASLGAYGTGWKYAVETFDSAYVKTNDLVNEFVAEGEKVEKELQDKLQAREVLDAKIVALKNKLGLNLDFNQVSEVERVEQLTAKVDNLTAAVTKLVETKQVAKPVTKVKKVAATAKTTVKKAAVKAKTTVKATVAKVTK